MLRVLERSPDFFSPNRQRALPRACGSAAILQRSKKRIVAESGSQQAVSGNALGVGVVAEKPGKNELVKSAGRKSGSLGVTVGSCLQQLGLDSRS